MKSDFINFKDIDLKNSSTWRGKKILSFDIDWASDEVLNHTIDLVEKSGVKCTFFVTHNTSILKRLNDNHLFELGIHPNFNPLLTRTSNFSAEEIISNLKHIVREAEVIRSHSLTTSGSWLALYEKAGFKYSSNYMMNGVSTIAPFYHVNGLVEVPIYYADDGHVFLNENLNIPRLSDTPDFNSDNTSIRVFNFHPIHVFLNTAKFSDYLYYKENMKKCPFNENAIGSKDMLMRLLND